MAPLTVKECRLIKALQSEKGWAVDRMIVDFLLILESRLGAKFVYITNLPRRFCCYLCFQVVHLPGAKQTIFNCHIHTLVFVM